MDSNLQTAAERMRRHYGPPTLPTAETAWQLALKIVFDAAPGSRAEQALGKSLEGSTLASACETARAPVATIAELLVKVPRGVQKAALVKALAAWWCRTFGDEPHPDWTGGVETYREELVRIRGLSPETADRLLLFVARLTAYPVDRASQRISVRHGWMEPQADYEEWQSFFLRGLEGSGMDPREFSLLAGRIGRDFCGPKPHCEECPLKPLLPERGPSEPEDV